MGLGVTAMDSDQKSQKEQKILQKKNEETLSHIKLPNILPEIFQIILRYKVEINLKFIKII